MLVLAPLSLNDGCPGQRGIEVMRVGLAIVVALSAILPVLPRSAVAYAGEELAAGTRVSIDQARAIALKARPGKITDEELEAEEGGSGLRYTFNIRRASKLYEVGIDAQSGKVLENILESNN